jgi:hypothetical protein
LALQCQVQPTSSVTGSGTVDKGFETVPFGSIIAARIDKQQLTDPA